MKFTSTILPPYLRRSKSIEELPPWLYLKGISTGDFSEALAALLGPDAPGLSATTITRLKADWWDDCERWSKRDMSARRSVYFWADGVYFSPRMDEDRQYMLVIIGADEWGGFAQVGGSVEGRAGGAAEAGDCAGSGGGGSHNGGADLRDGPPDASG